MLSKQPDRRRDALSILREELAAGHAGAGLPLGTLLEARWGRNPEQEAAYRQAMSYDDDYVASMGAGKLGVLLDTRGELTSALECYEFALERGFDEPGACLSCYIGWLRAYLAEGARSAFEAGLRRIGEDVVQRLGVDTEGLPGDRVAASRSRSPTGATRAGSLARCASRCFGCDERSGGPDRLVTLTLGRG